MAHLAHVHTPIEIWLNNRVVGGTECLQLAHSIGFTYQQGRTGPVALQIKMIVSLFSLPTAEQPTPILLDGTPGFEKHGREAFLTADNNTLVDDADGSLLAQREPEETEEQWAARIKALSVNCDTRLQLDHFEDQRDNGLIAFGALLRSHIMFADKGLNRFG